MADVAAEVVAALGASVAEVLPLIAARVPPGPATELGRLGSPPNAGRRAVVSGAATMVGMRGGRPGVVNRPALTTQLRAGRMAPVESAVVGAVRSVASLLAERLLGALELTVSDLDLTGVPDLSVYLGEPPTGPQAFTYSSQESQVLMATTLLERFRPGAADLAVALTGRLARHPLVAPLLVVPPDVTDEAAIAAAHGSGYLALGVAVARAVIGEWQPIAPVDGPAAAPVGVAIAAAVGLLAESPMPAGYAAALLAKVRAEYRLPRRVGGSVPVSGHRFALVEGEFPDTTEVSGNGLVDVVPGGAVIHTGVADGTVRIHLVVVDEPPPLETRVWDEVVEVSWHAAEGQASLLGPAASADHRLLNITPPWPGDYRLRVSARGRDDADDEEGYHLAVWAAPPAPEIVHKRTDRTGHRLRGEHEPDQPEPPERAYRWVRHSPLEVAATVTVVTGSTVADVLRAFGADPTRPRSLRATADDLVTEPWVATLDVGTAVLAVEPNGYQGADEAVLRRACAGGRAASMSWNVNAVTRLSFAEAGEMIASFEPMGHVDADPAIAAALDGLDFEDYRDKIGKGLVAVQRFTGSAITAEDLARIEAADIAFAITPVP